MTAQSSPDLRQNSPEPSLRAVMTPDVLGIAPDAPLAVALRLMVESGIRHLPVISEGRCTGLLHESDVLWELWSCVTEVRDAGALARRPPPSVDIDADVADAAAAMARGGSDAAVVTAHGCVAGIVTASDIVELVAHRGRRTPFRGR